MEFIDYINKHTTIEKNNISNLYRCNISNLLFSWEDSGAHFQYLIKNKLI